MIRIYYTQFDAPLPESIWNQIFSSLPDEIKQKITRYIRWQDQTACLIGKHLLFTALKSFGFQVNCLDNLRYTQYNRPYLDWSGDFNLSHSGNYVVCAVSDCSRVGVDVEKKRNIELKDFQKYMTSSEWNAIHQSHAPHDLFFQFWTAKESVIKGDGRGLSAPLDEVVLKNHSAMLSDATWRLHRIQLDPNHPCCLATNSEGETIEINGLDFANPKHPVK
ncbi:4'-phosphopantetheinyl transferase superfamily protein [bacterium]|nr:4'-phosphopantetheinyl transferase superfamily protein [bacterium]